MRDEIIKSLTDDVLEPQRNLLQKLTESKSRDLQFIEAALQAEVLSRTEIKDRLSHMLEVLDKTSAALSEKMEEVRLLREELHSERTLRAELVSQIEKRVEEIKLGLELSAREQVRKWVETQRLEHEKAKGIAMAAQSEAAQGLATLKAEIAARDNSIEKLTGKLKASHEQLMVEQSERVLLEEQLKKVSEQLDESQSKAREAWELAKKSEASLAEKSRFLAEKITEIGRLNRTNSELQRQREAALDRESQQRARYEARIEDTRTELGRRLSELTVENRNLSESYAKQVEGHKKEMEQLQARGIESARAADQFATGAREEIRSLKQELAKLRGDLSEMAAMKKMRDEAQAERESMRQLLLSKEGRIQAEEAELVRLREDISSRESQLKSYAEGLNKMKSEVREQANRLYQEIQMAKTVNPLSDYLKLTEREIVRVELQLKKTPTISPDRARLEECLTELVEQREFLRSSWHRSQADLESKLHRMAVIAGADALVMAPPPPPPTEPR